MESLFESHVQDLERELKRQRTEARFVNVVQDSFDRQAENDDDVVGRRLVTDVYAGDATLRALQTLLGRIDANGYERSAHQVLFHDAFTRCCSRILYREEWPVFSPQIMKHNKWNRCGSEMLISTPRRFGKTFSIAMYVACIALATKCEVVVFSPARRASRKLLERCVEFVRLLDAGDRIVEYNQEACRLSNFAGSNSLIRSFPSKVGVRCLFFFCLPEPHRPIFLISAHACAHFCRSTGHKLQVARKK